MIARLARVSVLALSLAGLPLACAWAAPGDEAPRDDAVIPPGQEGLFAAMLGRGAALPDGCAFTGGQIERTVARGVYGCPDGEVVIELRHPSAAPSEAIRTDKIAIVTAGGGPPAALLAALKERVARIEGSFEWLAPKQPHDEAGAPRRWTRCHPSYPLPGILGALVPDCYPRFVAALLGLGQTIVILSGLAYGLVGLARAPRDSEEA